MNAPARSVTVASRSRFKWVFPTLLALFALALLAAALFANVDHRQGWSNFGQQPRTGPPTNSVTVALPNLVRPLTPEQAVEQNLERPFDMVPDTPAQKFQLSAGGDNRGRAVECLTQAVYYEAASEGPEGQRAVAQVVLNRMRHPGFPSTVCGVVYQGSQLPTGCQFTFTCDGSLARTPIPSVWAQARQIASQALDGRVDAAVGHATHYHADYVVPYWADSLLKQVQIGHHIFYRLKGTLGAGTAFSQHYGGLEPNLPPPPSAVAVANEATDEAQQLLEPTVPGPPPVAADAAGLAAAQEPKQVLLADSNKAELLIDRGATPVQKGAPKQPDDCAAASSKRIVPVSPKDVRAGNSPRVC
jgi:hypothetical protein